MPGLIIRKTIRDFRVSILVWGGTLAAVMVMYVFSYLEFFGTGTDKDRLAEDYRQIADAMSFIIGKVYDVDTLGGFVTAEALTFAPLLISIVALLVGSATIRGEEERGALDLLLSTPHSRRSAFVQKWLGMALGLFIICAFGGVSLIIAAAVKQLELSTWGAIMAMVDMWLLTLIYGSLALLLGQLTTRRAAAGWTGGILTANYLMNTLSIAIPALEWLRYLTPFYYHNLSRPLAVSVGTDWVGIGILAVLALILGGLALLMYLNRDQNGVFELPWLKNRKGKQNDRLRKPGSIWLGNNFLFMLKKSLFSAVIWGAGLSVYLLILVPALDTMRSTMVDMLNSDFYKKLLGFKELVTNEHLMGLSFFLFAVALCAAFAVTELTNWTGLENNGQLNLVLSTPHSRWRMLLSRFIISLLAAAVLIGITWVTYLISMSLNNFNINQGRTAEAFIGLWVVCAIVSATGYLLTAFKASVAVAVLSGLVTISYLIELLASLLNLPDWVLNLSIFYHYGSPIIEGLKWTPQFVLLGVSAAFIVVAMWRFQKRDILSE